MEHKYDAAMSFDRNDRPYVEETVACAESLGMRVYYDKRSSNALWGNNFVFEQRKVYGGEARFVVAFLSRKYLANRICMDELHAAIAHQVEVGGGVILPVLMDDVEVPPHLISSQIGYLEAKDYSPEELARELFAKVAETKIPDADLRGWSRPPAGETWGRRVRLVAALGIIAVAMVAGAVFMPYSDSPALRPEPEETPSQTSSVAPTTPTRVPAGNHQTTVDTKTTNGATVPVGAATHQRQEVPPLSKPTQPSTSVSSPATTTGGGSCAGDCHFFPY